MPTRRGRRAGGSAERAINGRCGRRNARATSSVRRHEVRAAAAKRGVSGIKEILRIAYAEEDGAGGKAGRAAGVVAEGVSEMRRNACLRGGLNRQVVTRARRRLG